MYGISTVAGESELITVEGIQIPQWGHYVLVKLPVSWRAVISLRIQLHGDKVYNRLKLLCKQKDEIIRPISQRSPMLIGENGTR